jgi:membrane-associated protein
MTVAVPDQAAEAPTPSAVVTSAKTSETSPSPLSRFRVALLALAGVRAALGLIAIPLAPALYRDHFIVLVLLRPTKEVLLAGGFLFKRGDVGLPALLAAAVPLALWGVWHFFFIGRAYSKEIAEGDGLPRWATRILPAKRVAKMCEVLERKGTKVVVAGRVAAFPSALLGAAAGASKMEPRRFLIADSIGAAISIAEVVVAGYLLGAAYKEAGPWVTVAGVLALLGLLVYVGRALRKT